MSDRRIKYSKPTVAWWHSKAATQTRDKTASGSSSDDSARHSQRSAANNAANPRAAPRPSSNPSTANNANRASPNNRSSQAHSTQSSPPIGTSSRYGAVEPVWWGASSGSSGGRQAAASRGSGGYEPETYRGVQHAAPPRPFSPPAANRHPGRLGSLGERFTALSLGGRANSELAPPQPQPPANNRTPTGQYSRTSRPNALTATGASPASGTRSYHYRTPPPPPPPPSVSTVSSSDSRRPVSPAASSNSGDDYGSPLPSEDEDTLWSRHFPESHGAASRASYAGGARETLSLDSRDYRRGLLPYEKSTRVPATAAAASTARARQPAAATANRNPLTRRPAVRGRGASVDEGQQVSRSRR